jgi:hypothetical protein
MRWLLATIALLAASAGLLGWIYLRDRDTNWRPPEQQLASADAILAISELGGGRCRDDCQAKQLESASSHRWLVHVILGERRQCLQIDLDTFTVDGPHGLTGVQSGRCPSHRRRAVTL